MTWEEVRAAGGKRAVALLPAGAVEAHGPHLPLATDIIIAEAMARSAGERLAARGLEVVLLPSLAYTAAEFATAFAGTISVSGETVTMVIRDIARSLARHGFRCLGIANAHLDPAHLSALHAAVGMIDREGTLRAVFPDLTQKPWASRLTDEFRSGACHAGRFESSIVMAERPELVRDHIRVGLAPNPVSLSKAIRSGKSSFEDAGGPRAYFGYPADATVHEGQRTVGVLGSILEEAVVIGLEGLRESR